MNLFIILVIAISLSMDAFSLSLAYGTLDIDKKNIYTLSIIVGIYHFFMPLIGYFVGIGEAERH
jgi:putative Mn2+ efflux pump MntP